MLDDQEIHHTDQLVGAMRSYLDLPVKLNADRAPQLKASVGRDLLIWEKSLNILSKYG